MTMTCTSGSAAAIAGDNGDDDKYSPAIPTGEDNDGDAADTGKFTDDDGGW